MCARKPLALIKQPDKWNYEPTRPRDDEIIQADLEKLAALVRNGGLHVKVPGIQKKSGYFAYILQ